ncbi:hypothetical protein C2L64_44945 [Paraburkholderia hospita]|uniref:Uncharacterized protein n=1 Tax=Paraburkholderia hospita TaxID=169430 RepID=A0AAN1JK71_9BURK|nr:hypothetical protein C2L64_44945 [Paraburkholderia hospita]
MLLAISASEAHRAIADPEHRYHSVNPEQYFGERKAESTFYWETRLKRADVPEERRAISQVLQIIAYPPAQRQHDRQALTELKVELRYWASQYPRLSADINRVVDGLPPFPGFGDGNNANQCDELQKDIDRNEANLRHFQQFLSGERDRDLQAIQLLHEQIAALRQQQLEGCRLAVPHPEPQSKDVLTQHNNNQRTGAVLNETRLTTNTVQPGRFGRLFSRDVDGDIYAQPLYVQGLTTPGNGTHNVVFVATTNNSVYAFDADNPAASDPLWKVSLGASIPIPNAYMANTPTSCMHGLYNMNQTGITATPVIDRVRNIMYVVSVTLDPNILRLGVPIINQKDCSVGRGRKPVVVIKLHALDIRTGAHLRNPQKVTAAVPGTGAAYADAYGKIHQTDALNNGGRPMLFFNPEQQLPRAGLLLSNGIVYLAFGSYADIEPYHGWVIAYDATTLKQLAAYVTTPNGAAGGIWQAGQGLAEDELGFIYAMSGNGSFDPGINQSNSFVKLAPGSLQLTDWFTSIWSRYPEICSNTNPDGTSTSRCCSPKPGVAPYDDDCLTAWDADMGSAGPLVIPQRGKVVGGGKMGILYLLDTAGLGHLQTTSEAQFPRSFQATIADGCEGAPAATTHHIHGSPVFWDGPNGPVLYVWGENDFLRAYALDTWTNAARTKPATGQLPPAAATRVGIPLFQSKSVAPCGMPGSMLALSAQGALAGTGIIWATHPLASDAVIANVPGVLEAYDAERLGEPLWSSASDDPQFGFLFGKFTPPTIANGRVYIGTFKGNATPAKLVVYGLLPVVQPFCPHGPKCVENCIPKCEAQGGQACQASCECCCSKPAGTVCFQPK